MITLAHGVRELRALERTLGGKPPASAASRSLAELKRHVRGRFQQRKARWAATQPQLERAQAPLLELVKADRRAVQGVEARRKLVAAHKPKPRAKRTPLAIAPRMVAGSGFWLKAPPYDLAFDPPDSGNASGSADAASGTYGFGMSGGGSSSAASAGLGIWFFATAADPAQRIAALFDFDFAWFDSSTWYTAHNDGGTNIWVWGAGEGQWVLQQGFDPSWSDGTSGLQDHGSGGDGSEQFGRESLEAFFPVNANSWYLVWIWSEGSCDDSNGAFGFSYAQQYQHMSVPFVVFGSLF
jgi:hypothetical protein